mgnify:CR=1 FL=1
MLNVNSHNPWADLGLAAPPPPSTAKKELDQAAFLRLMTEQLKNQDPLKPLGSQEFLGQMAQFSTVQGIHALNSTFQGLAAAMMDTQALDAVSLVGHDAMVVAERFGYAGGGIEGEIGAPMAGRITYEISNAAGEVVHRGVLDATRPGYVPFAWDGLDAEGNPFPPGEYRIAARVSAGDRTEAAVPSIKARVDSVSLTSQGIVLNLSGLGAAPLSAVRRIG